VNQPLPTFERPPVVETVMGFQFRRLAAFRSAHLGLFWDRLRRIAASDEWTTATDANPIEVTYEQFEPEGMWTPLGPTFRISQEPQVRLQIRNSARDRMVQVQNGRLHLNWISAGDVYPRYERVRTEFDRLYTALESFVQDEQLGQLQPDQWEITYVNHVPRGPLWAAPADWPKILLLLGQPPEAPLLLEGFGGEWHFEIPPRRGRLHVTARRAQSDGTPPDDVLRLDLTARGPATDKISAGDGLNLGRQTIVTAFAAITTREAQTCWGRRT